MEVVLIKVTGGKDTLELKEQIKPSELIKAPYELFEKYYEGNYSDDMVPLGIENIEFLKAKNFNTQALLNKLMSDTEKLLNATKNNLSFDPNIGTIQPSRFMPTLGKLQRHTFSLSSLNKDSFELVAKDFSKNINTNSPFAFLKIDEKNRLIHVTESIKTITKYNKDVMFDKKPRNFFSSQGSRHADRISNGLNHTSDYKHFNFNLNVEAQSLFESLHRALDKSEDELAVCFRYGNDEQKNYYKSNLYNQAATEQELKAIKILESIKDDKSKQHTERQGSLSPKVIDDAVENRSKTEKKISSIDQFKKEHSHESASDDKEDGLQVVEDDYKKSSVARAKFKEKYVLVNGNREVISDTFISLSEPISEEIQKSNVSYLVGKKNIQDKEYYGVIGFDGKDIVPFEYESEKNVHEALNGKVKEFNNNKNITKDTNKDSTVSDTKDTQVDTSIEVSDKSALDKYLTIIKQNKLSAQSALQTKLIQEIQGVFDDKQKYVDEFYSLLKTGGDLSFAVDRIKERYQSKQNMQFIFKFISSEVQIDLESAKEKDEIINILDSDNRQLQENIATLNGVISERENRLAEVSSKYDSLTHEFSEKVIEYDGRIETMTESIIEKENRYKEVLALKEKEVQSLIQKSITQEKSYSESIAKLEKEVETLGKKSITQEKAYGKLEEELGEEKKRVHEFESKYDVLNQEFMQSSKENRETIASFIKKETSLEEKIEKLESEKLQLLKEIQEERDADGYHRN